MEDLSVDLSVDGRIILKAIFTKWDEKAHGLGYLLHDWDRRRAFVSAVMNIRLP